MKKTVLVMVGEDIDLSPFFSGVWGPCRSESNKGMCTMK